MIRRLAGAAGIATKLGNHSLRATGITAYLKNEHARKGRSDRKSRLDAHDTALQPPVRRAQPR